MRRDVGFTLIEMSIVLVVIGLIVGGVLAGKELIHSAILRKQVTQIEQYNTAVTTFFGKYNTFPGDLSPADAAAFGFANRSGARGHGDENGVLEPCDTSNSFAIAANPIGCEHLLFWGDLSIAGLIDGNFRSNTDSNMNAASLVQSKLYNPSLRLGDGYLLAASDTTRIGYYVATKSFTTAGGSGGMTSNYAFKAIDALNMDVKMDDGLPESGVVIPVELNQSFLSPGNLTFHLPNTSNGCILSSNYNLALTIDICTVAFRMNGT